MSEEFMPRDTIIVEFYQYFFVTFDKILLISEDRIWDIIAIN